MKSKQFLSNTHLYFGIIPDDWKWKTIDEIKGNGKSLVSGPFGSNIGKRFFRPTGVPVIRGNNLKRDKFIDSGFVFVDDEKAEELKNCVALEDDVIFTAAGTIGQVGIIPKNGKYRKYIISNKQLRLRLDTAIVNPLFAFYWFSSNRMQEYLIILNVGSALPLLTLRELKSVPIPIPSLTIQNKIVIILNNFYEKIQNLQNQNRILEQMAQTIFKSWFVDFDGVTEFEDSELGKIPKGWSVGTFSDIIDEIESGKRPKGGINSLDSEIPSIGAENIIGLGEYNYSKTKFVSLDFFNVMKNGKIKENDVLVYKDGASLGRSSLFRNGFPFQKCCINEHVFILRPSEKISSSFLFFWIDQDFMKQEIINLNSNSAQPGINKPGVLSLPILIPEINMNEKFGILLEPLLTKFFKNILNINQLTKTRDALLPKLMSGEIRV